MTGLAFETRANLAHRSLSGAVAGSYAFAPAMKRPVQICILAVMKKHDWKTGVPG